MSWKKGRKVAKGKTHSGTYGQTDRRRETRADEQASGQKDGRTEGWAEKRMHGRTGKIIGWTDGRKKYLNARTDGRND